MALALPIDPLVPRVIEALERNRSLVLEAAPGAGKTTRVPPALLSAGFARGREIVVLQPRRLPTRLAARRVAEELGERVGETVGYQVRFEDVGSAKTRLRFVTEGILTRRLLSDPTLKDVSCVVLDEFHERHIASDLALAMLRKLQHGARPDLRVLVMSATLDAQPIAEFLGCDRLRSEGARFPVGIEHLATPDDRYLDQQVLAALKRLVADQLDGHVLVFLPGASEIRRAREACSELCERHQIEIHALHGELSPAEQDLAVKPSERRKLILSTNVAETSVTIEGVAAVIDSGLARVASHSAWSGLPVLNLAKISQASATQRAGRAGRTRAGRCLRLYTEHDFRGRPEHDVPEIRRVDLAETTLSLHAVGESPASFEFFETPAPAAIAASEKLLSQLGAIRDGKLTALGNRLTRFPVHPRLARLIVESEARGIPEDGSLAAAIIGERDIRSEGRARFDGRAARGSRSGSSDVLDAMERFRLAARDGLSRRSADSAGLELSAAQIVERTRRQLERSADRSTPSPPRTEEREQAVMMSLLAAFPDRVAQRRQPHSPEIVLAAGGSAVLADTSVVHDPMLLVALDAEERGVGRAAKTTVRMASAIEPEWLLEICTDQLLDEDSLEWNERLARVDRVKRLSIGNVVLDESRSPAPSSEAAARLLLEHAARDQLIDPERLAQWKARVRLLTSSGVAQWPVELDALVDRVLTQQAANVSRVDELAHVPWFELLTAALGPGADRLLATHAPERLTLAGGRAVKVHYENDQPPWIESRLQDFFGSRSGPKIAQGRVPLVLHLLAPSQRPVQVTSDLAGFWERHYPAIRRELMRKYPRHAWPEDPLSAQPPQPKR